MEVVPFSSKNETSFSSAKKKGRFSSKLFANKTMSTLLQYFSQCCSIITLSVCIIIYKYRVRLNGENSIFLYFV